MVYKHANRNVSTGTLTQPYFRAPAELTVPMVCGQSGAFPTGVLLMESYSSKRDMSTVRHYSLEHSSWLLTVLLENLYGI